MASVQEHYDNFLAYHYSWLYGGRATQLQENREFFRYHQIRPTGSACALDLGSGTGFQTIPLAEVGYNVIAMDLSRQMLSELESLAGDLSVKVVCDNLLNFTLYSPAEAELCVCMGDTLTHLRGLDEVDHLFSQIYKHLERGGRLILSFRDLTPELKGVKRFIPVRSDADRIFTCYLEFRKHEVDIYDIIHERCGGHWNQKISTYKKVRISPTWTYATLKGLGFKIDFQELHSGIVCVVARKA
jgi:SAM-dependent methyltransferase